MSEGRFPGAASRERANFRAIEKFPRELRHSSWHGGQLLAFSALDGVTDYQDGLTARTAFGAPCLEVLLPMRCRIRFPKAAADGNVVTGDCFHLETEPAVTGVFLDAHHLLIEGPCAVSDVDLALAVAANGTRTLIGSARHYDPAKIAADLPAVLEDRGRWLRSLRFPSLPTSLAKRTLTKACSIMKTQVYSPEGRIRHRWTTPDRWPHRQMWLWDSAFHAIGWRHIAPRLAQDAILAVFDMQATNGFVPHMMNPNGASQITQPPVLALGAKLVHDVTGDNAWLKALYPCLRAYLAWDLKNRDLDGCGLCEWQMDADPHCRSGESGMDNSPRFDSATRMAAVDFNSYLSLECEILAKFARDLGFADDAALWRDQHLEINRRIATRLWSEDLGFFVDYDTERQTPSSVLASSGFLPLICGAASRAHAARLAECLSDPTMFGTALSVPSIAARDKGRYAKDMWRGPVWINLNWLIARGFERYGFIKLAEQLRSRTMEAIEDAFAKHGTLFEFYDDRQEIAPPRLLRKGQCAPEASPYHQVFHDYGWTATLYVDFAFTHKSSGES